MTLVEILERIVAERVRQDDKWGEQNHPDVYRNSTGEAWPPGVVACLYGIPTADRARTKCDNAAKDGRLTNAAILVEELCETVEAAAEGNPDELTEELIQVAAAAIMWIQAIDRRRSN